MEYSKLSDIAYSIRKSCHDSGYIELFPQTYVKSDKIDGFKFIYKNSVYVMQPDITTRLMNSNMKENSRIYYISQQINEFLDESLKAGLEIIGGNEEKTNIEILTMVIKILDNLGINDYNIDLSLTDIFDPYRKKKESDRIINAVRTRNYPALQNMEIEGKDKLFQIMDTRARNSGIDQLDSIVEKINDPRVIIDLGTVRQPEYYQGLIFEIYGKYGFLGGGGNYIIKNVRGCGFSVDLYSILKLYNNSKKEIKR